MATIKLIADLPERALDAVVAAAFDGGNVTVERIDMRRLGQRSPKVEWVALRVALRGRTPYVSEVIRRLRSAIAQAGGVVSDRMSGRIEDTVVLHPRGGGPAEAVRPSDASG